MGSLNTLRAVLVGGAALAAVVLAIAGQWVPFAVLTAGIAAHGALWLWLWRQRDDGAGDDASRATPGRADR